jgi:isochorismate synthase
MSLAGTKPLSKKAMPWGEKEQSEQAYVTDFIIEKISSQGIGNLEITGPYDVEAGPVLHVRTDINFDMENQKSIDIALKLHPTPAVSGFPQKEAIDLINSKELHAREFYTGIIGFIAQNSTSLYVNLRCCQIQKGNAYLYLGGGFTADSVPELEWEETENKSRTLLNIIETL